MSAPSFITNGTPTPMMISEAAERVYFAWLPFIGEAEARAQADAFARRFLISIDGPLKPLQVPA